MGLDFWVGSALTAASGTADFCLAGGIQINIVIEKTFDFLPDGGTFSGGEKLFAFIFPSVLCSPPTLGLVFWNSVAATV